MIVLSEKPKKIKMLRTFMKYMPFEKKFKEGFIFSNDISLVYSTGSYTNNYVSERWTMPNYGTISLNCNNQVFESE